MFGRLPSSLLDITWLWTTLLRLTTDLDTFFGAFSFSFSSTSKGNNNIEIKHNIDHVKAVFFYIFISEIGNSWGRHFELFVTLRCGYKDIYLVILLTGCSFKKNTLYIWMRTAHIRQRKSHCLCHEFNVNNAMKTLLSHY